MKDDRGGRVLLQAQLLAQVVVGLLVVLLPRLLEIHVAQEALLSLLDLLC